MNERPQPKQPYMDWQARAPNRRLTRKQEWAQSCPPTQAEYGNLVLSGPPSCLVGGAPLRVGTWVQSHSQDARRKTGVPLITHHAGGWYSQREIYNSSQGLGRQKEEGSWAFGTSE